MVGPKQAPPEEAPTPKPVEQPPAAKPLIPKAIRRAAGTAGDAGRYIARIARTEQDEALRAAKEAIDKARTSASKFLEEVSNELVVLLRKENLVSNLPSQLQRSITNRGKLSAGETAQVLGALQQNEAVQEYLVKKLVALPADDFLAVGNGLRMQNIITNEIAEAAFIHRTRTSFLDDIAVLATLKPAEPKPTGATPRPPTPRPRPAVQAPDEVAAFRASLEETMRNASPGARIDLKEIILKLMQGTSSQEMMKALESIKTGFRVGSPNQIEDGITVIKKILESYSGPLPSRGLEDYLNADDLVRALRNEIQDLINELPDPKDRATFIKTRVEPVLSKFQDPVRTAVERFLEVQELQVKILSTAPEIARLGAGIEDDIALVRDSIRWGGIKRVVLTTWSFPKRAFTWFFGDKWSGKAIDRAIVSGEPIKGSFFSKHPVFISFIVTGLVGWAAWYYAVSPAWDYGRKRYFPSEEMKAEQRKERTLIKIVEKSEVWKLADKEIQVYLLDPKNYITALWIVNEPMLRKIAEKDKDKANLNKELSLLRDQITKDESLAKAAKAMGEGIASEAITDYEEAEKTGPIIKYQAGLKIRLSGVYAALNAENQSYLYNPKNIDIAYWIVKHQPFIGLASQGETEILNDEILKLRQNISKDENLAGAMASRGRELMPQQPEKVTAVYKAPAALTAYEAESAASISRQLIDVDSVIQKEWFSGNEANKKYIEAYPDIWYFYNLVAKLAIKRNKDNAKLFTLETANEHIYALRLRLDKLKGTEGHKQTLKLITAEVERLAVAFVFDRTKPISEKPAPVDQLSIIDVYQLLGIEDPKNLTPKQVQAQTEDAKKEAKGPTERLMEVLAKKGIPEPVIKTAQKAISKLAFAAGVSETVLLTSVRARLKIAGINLTDAEIKTIFNYVEKVATPKPGGSKRASRSQEKGNPMEDL